MSNLNKSEEEYEPKHLRKPTRADDETSWQTASPPRRVMMFFRLAPPEPYKPGSWWTDHLYRYLLHLRDLVKTWAAAVLSAIVALDFQAHSRATSDNFLVADFKDYFVITVAGLSVWFFVHVGYKYWLLSKIYPWLSKDKPSFCPCLIVGFTVGTVVFTVILVMMRVWPGT